MRIAEPASTNATPYNVNIGTVAVCSVGRVGLITAIERFSFRDCEKAQDYYVGIGFDGKGTWASREPCIVAESAEEFRDKLDTRFGGRMSHNS